MTHKRERVFLSVRLDPRLGVQVELERTIGRPLGSGAQLERGLPSIIVMSPPIKPAPEHG